MDLVTKTKNIRVKEQMDHVNFLVSYAVIQTLGVLTILLGVVLLGLILLIRGLLLIPIKMLSYFAPSMNTSLIQRRLISKPV